MKTVAFNKNFGENFAKKYVPKIYIGLIRDELNKKKYTSLLTHIKEKFNITKTDIINVTKTENIAVSQVENNYTICFKDILIKSKMTFEQLIDYINDGDLSFKGYNMFNKITTYVNNHIRTIYHYYLIRGD